MAPAPSPVRTAEGGGSTFFLVPKLHLGTQLDPKLRLEVPTPLINQGLKAVFFTPSPFEGGGLGWGWRALFPALVKN